MKFLRKLFGRKWTPTLPANVAVRNAMHVVLEGYDISDDDFEKLYCTLLEDEVCGNRDAAKIFRAYMDEGRIKPKA